MKKLLRHRTLWIIISLGSFLIVETACFIRLFRVEEETFQTEVNQAISFAIEKIPYIPTREPRYDIRSLSDYTQPGRISIIYRLHGEVHRIDTTGEFASVFNNRVHYDLHHEYWDLELLDSCFKTITPYPELSVTFARQDTSRQTIDYYPPLASLPSTPPAYDFQLGHIHPDHLLVWYRLPFAYFWKHQQDGVIISIFPFLLFLCYAIVILRKEKNRKYESLCIEKQIIFVHDLKTPLATNNHIGERLCTNLSSQSPRQIREALAILHRQSSHLLAELEQFTRPASCQHGNISPHNLSKQFERLIADYQSTYPHAHITLNCHGITQEIPGDPFHILHILDNLLSNAVKHISSPVNIHIKCSEDSRHRLCICIRDNGPGIPLRFQRHIYQSGFHARHDSDSHGLGLAYVRRAIRTAGGTLRLHSREGQGTEFFLSFQPGKLNTTRPTRLAPHFYCYIPIILLVAEIIWTSSLLKAEQTKFIEHESQLIEECIVDNNVKFHGIKGTSDLFFKNNPDEQSITIFRHGQDTTISMNTYSPSNSIYGNLFYDLRDTLWNLDTLHHLYSSSTTQPYPIAMLRKNASGHLLDYTDTLPCSSTPSPLIYTTPLGFLEGHRLEVRFYLPNGIFFAHHADWLFLALFFTLATFVAGFYLTHLTRRLQAYNHFQREDVQYLLRKLHPHLLTIVRQEEQWATSATLTPTELAGQLPANIARYHHALRLVNVLLDRIIAFRTQQ